MFKLARSSVRYESLKCACDWILEGPYTRLLGIRGFGGWCGFCHELFVAVDAYVSVFWVVAFKTGYGEARAFE